MEWVWWSNEPSHLARMVDPDLFEGREDFIPPTILSLRSEANKEAAVQALYDLLKAKELYYDVNPPDDRDQSQIPSQKIRQPHKVFNGARGNCLDLALIFCGICENARLRPFLALLSLQGRQSRHAIVVVGPSLRDDPQDRTEADLQAVNGVRTAMPWEEISLLLQQGWLAVDLTVATRWDDGTPDRPADFGKAREAAVYQLEHAAEITVLDIVHLHQHGPEKYSAPPLSAAADPVLCAEVRERYRSALLERGLEVPDRWGLPELRRLQRVCRGQASCPPGAGDLLEALCGALEAISVFEQIGGRELGFRRLQYLYHRHVGRWPAAGSREGMLVTAASARITELRSATSDPGYQPEPLTAIARFMLGVAGDRKPHATVDLDDPGLRDLSDWLTRTLGHQRDDAAAYLADRIGGRTWAIIELKAEGPADDAWPDRIIVDLVGEHGPGRTRNVHCDSKSGEGIRKALRSAVSRLPEGEVFVDLVLPRHLLDAGVEHWDVVDVGGQYESLRQHLEPRLRWSMHHSDRWLRDRLARRFSRLAWLADPEVVPEVVSADPVKCAEWLCAWESNGAAHPPYFAGSPPDRPGQDLLTTMLRHGCGFVVWFASATRLTIKECARDVARDLPALERRHDLPEILARALNDQHPVIIWSDPDGRAGFPLPAPRRGGTLRGGTR